MPRPCTICCRPDQDVIDARLADRVPLRKLAAETGASVSALMRHKAHAARPEAREDDPLALLQAQVSQLARRLDSLMIVLERQGIIQLVRPVPNEGLPGGGSS